MENKRWFPPHPARAQRFAIQQPLLYRCRRGEVTWREGRTQNISHAGILFWAHTSLEVETRVELEFQMPVEIGGEVGDEVVCWGKIVRIVPSSLPDLQSIAARISNYHVVRKTASQHHSVPLDVVESFNRRFSHVEFGLRGHNQSST
jgi:hypothetical protein